MRLLKKYKQTFLHLLLADTFILLLHLIFAKHSTLFHLDFEMNVPTIYQSGKLIIFSCFLLHQLVQKHIPKNVLGFFIPLALFMFALGMDELLQIHENIYRIFEWLDIFHPSKIVDASMKMGYRSSLWILYYLPVFFAFFLWLGYWLRFFQTEIKQNFHLLTISAGAIFTVLLAEVLSSTGSYSSHAYFWLTTVEEMAEMLFASSMIWIGMKVLHRHRWK